MMHSSHQSSAHDFEKAELIMVDSQNYNALPVVVSTLLGLLMACLVGWAFAFSIVFSDSRPDDIYAAHNTFSIALGVQSVVAVVILVLPCCFKDKLQNKAAGYGLILAGATNLVTAFVLIRTFDSHHKDSKVTIPTWILSSLPCFLWIIAGLLILKLPGKEVDGTLISTAELETAPTFYRDRMR
jgi:hypothetical protein